MPNRKTTSKPGKLHIHTWKRFIDDIFVIWTGSIENLHTYMKQINQIHDTIKFTYEASNTEVTFLDVTVYKGEKFTSTGILDVRTHIKPTSICTCLIVPPPAVLVFLFSSS